MKRNRLFAKTWSVLAGMLAKATVVAVLTLGLVLTGCDNGNGGDPDLSGTITITDGTNPVSSATTGDQLTAAYSGSESGFTYQWNKDGTAISGETNQTYTPSEAGSYTVTVSAAGYNSKTSNAVTVTDPVTYAIGDTGPGGGIIFYVSTTGFTSNSVTCHYLEAAPADMGTNLRWSSGTSYNSYDISGASGTAVGTGAENTAAILAVDANAPAAKACADYTNGGKSDWFLPSRDELNQMYQNKTAISGFINDRYWSSSQNDSTSVRIQNFSDGSQGNYTKYSTICVRAVRAF